MQHKIILDIRLTRNNQSLAYYINAIALRNYLLTYFYIINFVQQGRSACTIFLTTIQDSWFGLVINSTAVII